MSNSKRPKRLDRTTVYKSGRIVIHTDKVEFPAGRIIENLHVLDYPKEGVGVLVVDDQQRILLEYAYRYHTGKDGWELPAGAIDEGESVVKAGEREVLEETGYETKNHKLVYSFNPSNGSSNQVLHIVFCELASKDQQPFDENEVREVKWFTQEEIKTLIKEKKIFDGHALLGLTLFLGNFTALGDK